MPLHLPSLAWLRAAEAVARHQSFSRAAIELNVTQTAVSHQIRKLEALLGTTLFVRNAGSVKLTHQGKEYLADIRPLIVGVVHATDRIRQEPSRNTLTIGSPGTFMLKCLVPAISAFAAANPDLDVRLRTLDPYGREERSEMFRDLDIIIRYGLGSFTGYHADRIAAETIFPVCSPALLHGESAPYSPEILSRHRIIRSTTPRLLRDDWPLWLQSAGVPKLTFSDEICCDLLYSCFEIAACGGGFAMGRTPTVDLDLDQGRLIAPFRHRLQSNSGYYLTVALGSEEQDKIKAFRAWLLARYDTQPAV